MTWTLDDGEAEARSLWEHDLHEWVAAAIVDDDIEKWDPDQPRDDHGRFGEGSEGGGALTSAKPSRATRELRRMAGIDPTRKYVEVRKGPGRPPVIHLEGSACRKDRGQRTTDAAQVTCERCRG